MAASAELVEAAAGQSQQTSRHSEGRSNGLNAHSQPQTIGDFIALVNEVAVGVLNNEIPIDQARTFAALARVVSQSMSTRVQAMRFLPNEQGVLELK